MSDDKNALNQADALVAPTANIFNTSDHVRRFRDPNPSLYQIDIKGENSDVRGVESEKILDEFAGTQTLLLGSSPDYSNNQSEIDLNQFIDLAKII